MYPSEIIMKGFVYSCPSVKMHSFLHRCVKPVSNESASIISFFLIAGVFLRFYRSCCQTGSTRVLLLLLQNLLGAKCAPRIIPVLSREQART